MRDGSIHFFWNGTQVTGHPGDSVAAALWRAGVRMLGVSRKRHRPMGVSTYLQGALVTVDGRPHCRADLTPIRPGMRVWRQNSWPSPRFDLLAALRLVPSGWVRGGFEQTRLFPGGSRRFTLYEYALRFLAGEVDVDRAPADTGAVPQGQRIDVDLVVAGGGPSGVEAANDAALQGRRVAIVSRGDRPGRTATALGAPPKPLHPDVIRLLSHEVAGVYRDGKVVVAAPLDGIAPATVLATERLTIATGKRPCPVVVPGHDLPGSIDARLVLLLAAQIGRDLGSTVVIEGHGSGVGEALERLGVPIVATLRDDVVTRITGRSEVTGVQTVDRYFACTTVIHAGSWRTDPSLVFQAGAAGELRLARSAALPPLVTVVGTAALPDEPISFGADAPDRTVAICPCMDVTAGELLDVASADGAHSEELKRQTSCGMGPCQGVPCWYAMNALLARVMPGRVDDHPSFRAPRRSISIAQAAGIDGLIAVQK